MNDASDPSEETVGPEPTNENEQLSSNPRNIPRITARRRRFIDWEDCFALGEWIADTSEDPFIAMNTVSDPTGQYSVFGG